jgi:site-specific DNA-cytosine methylase
MNKYKFADLFSGCGGLSLGLPVHVLQALLLIVLRLRNNLFHGEKWAYGIAGQRQNFQHACAVMMATMDLGPVNTNCAKLI